MIALGDVRLLRHADRLERRASAACSSASTAPSRRPSCSRATTSSSPRCRPRATAPTPRCSRSRSSGSRTSPATGSPRARAAPCRGRCPTGRPSPRCPRRSRSCAGAAGASPLLSNTDRDLIAASQRALGVPFDLTIVAEDVQSYKPAHAHWERFFELTTADREHHVHVAASRFHDIAPARRAGAEHRLDRSGLGEDSQAHDAAVKADRTCPTSPACPTSLDELAPA